MRYLRAIHEQFADVDDSFLEKLKPHQKVALLIVGGLVHFNMHMHIDAEHASDILRITVERQGHDSDDDPEIGRLINMAVAAFKSVPSLNAAEFSHNDIIVK